MKLLFTTAAAAALAATGAFAQDDTPMIDAESVTFADGSVTFATVTAASDGYLVIHETDQNGAPVAPESIGHVAISAGENTDVTVTPDPAFEDGATYIAMLHEETNGNDTYDFGPDDVEDDTPVMLDGSPVVEPFVYNADMSGEMSDDHATDDDMSGDDMDDDDMDDEASN
ncbi:DUF7282 domain-containing protein [Pseudoroseicyclus sp. H15]